MSISYAEPEVPAVAAHSAIFSASPATKFATSALFVLATVSTTSGAPLAAPVSLVGRPIADVQGNGGQVASIPASDADLVKWIKDESGLTWDQIARAFDVSRRAVHLWATGGRVSAGNAEALQAFAALVRGAAGASPTETRNALLTLGSDGLSPIDRFRRAQHDASSSVAGTPFDPIALLGETAGDDQ